MNVTNFIFQLLHICNHPTLCVLTPLRSPYTPSADYENTSNDYTDFLVDCAHNSYDYANTPNDQAKIVVDSADMHEISYVDFCIPNFALLQLLSIFRSKIKITFIATPTLGSRPRQGFARLRAKREAQGSHHMFSGVQRVRE
jgi:hypothetical protein